MKKILHILLLAVFTFASVSAAPPAGAAWQSKLDASLLEFAAQVPGGEQTEFIVFLDEQADLSAAAGLPTKAEKGRYVYEQLTALAARTQPPVIAALEDLQQADPSAVEYRPYWVANMIWVRGGSAALQTLASRRDVSRVYANPQVQMDLPAPQPNAPASPLDTEAVEWNITRVRAPQVWAQGNTGQGVVVGGQDTGYAWEHPALKSKYRGWNGVTADHNYSWHDAIHTGVTSCGVNSPFPCDDGNHGTHTMGTMVGDDGGANQVGMAPGAKWIGCRNMAEGNGTPATYMECYQWFIAPTDLNNQNPRPDLAPDVINNSWSCPVSEGCTDPNALLVTVNNVRAAGIVTVHSAGNSGPSCSTVSTPAAIYDASFSVGATDINDNIAGFSSRGPVVADGSGRMKPDISAPGASIRSSVPGGGYSSLQGTSMASPHVAGLVALLLSARPSLAGDVDQIEQIIQSSAVPKTHAQICGGIPGSQVPNNTFGYGLIDALAMVESLEPHSLGIDKSSSAAFYTPGEVITYTLRISHAHASDPTVGVVLTDTLPTGVSFVSATAPYTLQGQVVRWDIASMAAGENRTVQLVVDVPAGFTGPLVNADYGVLSSDVAYLPGPPLTLLRTEELLFNYLTWINPGP